VLGGALGGEARVLDPSLVVDGEAQPIVPAVALADGSLGPNSRIDELQARLAQLGEAGYVKKQTLWTSLVNAEESHRVRREFLEAQRLRQESMSRGEAPADVKEAKDVLEPSAEERARHELAHIPAQPECTWCTLGHWEDACQDF